MVIPIIIPSPGVPVNPWRERPSRLFGAIAAILLLFMVTLRWTQEFLLIFMPGLFGQAIPPVYLAPTVMVLAIFSYVAYVFLGLGVLVGAEKVTRLEGILYGAGLLLGAVMFPVLFLNLDSLTAAGCQLAPVTNEAGFVLGCSPFLP